VKTAPSATYRLQLHRDFPFSAAADLLDYLEALGVGAIYLSPVLQAGSGSTHGYDVVDHTRVDAERGGADAFANLCAAAAARGLGIVVDLVPNHMGVGVPAENPAWWDLLARGQMSPFAIWFDIDWSVGPPLLPVLGDDADVAVDVEVVPSTRTESGLELRYYDHAFPVATGTGPRPGESAVDVLERQNYRLAPWREGADHLNYRRFFAITDLAGIRVEDAAVFAATHRLALEWVAGGQVQGLRIDHPDGLVDPREYLERLQAAAPGAWITVEKILEPGEQLPDWPVAGTTGYDALTEVTQVLTDLAGADSLVRTFTESTGDDRHYDDYVADGKREMVTTQLYAEVNRLHRLVPDLPGAAAALVELAVAFPVYRSYLPSGVDLLEEAARVAGTRNPTVRAAVTTLLPRLRNSDDELARRFQQLTGAVMAKGVEDTAYYRYTAAAWSNEVGGDPGRIGESLGRFHTAQEQRQQRHPFGMTTLSTHDTKRSEDVRARLAVLAEIPDRWADLTRTLAGLVTPRDPALAMLLQQTLIGAGFIDRARLHAYAEKAMREAGTGTRWADPEPAFERAVHAEVDAYYDNGEARAHLESFISDVVEPGWSNALSQKLIQLTMPGVPDVYQGTELWDDSLVDPDNRRPVDYEVRRRQLRAVTAAAPPPPIDETGAAKLLVTHAALSARRARPQLFARYAALRADGSGADHLIGFDRGGAITLATRLPVGLRRADGWGATTVALPPGAYRDALTGRPAAGTQRVADLLAHYPVALLLAEPD
jgi:(1->4)-alpha-D-glucan 1-alpha-D-glucosylmutase